MMKKYQLKPSLSLSQSFSIAPKKVRIKGPGIDAIKFKIPAKTLGGKGQIKVQYHKISYSITVEALEQTDGGDCLS